LLFSIVVRALKAPGSRHAVFRRMPHDHGVTAWRLQGKDRWVLWVLWGLWMGVSGKTGRTGNNGG
jgi:hypothetical protein